MSTYRTATYPSSTSPDLPTLMQSIKKMNVLFFLIYVACYTHSSLKIRGSLCTYQTTKLGYFYGDVMQFIFLNPRTV